MTNYKYIGKGRPLHEGREKVTGFAKYVADVEVHGMVHGRPILSPYAHAKILSVDKSMAEEVDGVIAVLTAEDLPTRDRTITSRNSAILAKEKVLWVGQPVALVVAESPAIAADAADLVFVDYEPLPAAIHLRDAIKPDAPTLWPNGLPKDGMVSLHSSMDEEEEQGQKFNNVTAENTFSRGDIAVGFAEADLIVENTYHTNFVHQAYMEPHAVVAVPDPLGGLLIYTSTQGKFVVRDEVARLLDLPKRSVRVLPMTMGGGFGAKYGILDPLAASVACALNRPISIVFSRSEDFLATTPAPAITIDCKMGIKNDGTLTALQARVFTDMGAFGFGHGGLVSYFMGGLYKWPHMQIDTYEVNTNKTPVGAYRAPGSPQASFAVECNLDEMVRQLGLDPLEVRLKNAAEAGDLSGVGRPWPSIGFKEVLTALGEHPMWQERHTNADEGIGLALGAWAPAMGTADAVCRVDTDGSASIELGHVDVSGNNSSMVLIVAEALGIAPDDVLVKQGDTSDGAYAPNSGGSQVTYTIAGAVDGAAKSAREKLLRVAAEHFEADSADIELADGQAQVKGVPDKAISIGELAGKARSTRGGFGPIIGEASAAPETNSPAVAAHLVKVRVDRDTGEITPLHYVIAQDVGFAINPTLVEGQIHGGMAQGIGMALNESFTFDDDGQLLTGSFTDYDLPRTDSLPTLEAIMVNNPSPHGPFGARGVGEPPITGGLAAIANAVKDATGVRVDTVPIRAEMLWEADRS